MRDAAFKVLKHTHGLTRDQFDDNEILVLAILRLLEIIGEAAKNVSDTIKSEHPDIPWKSISGARNRLIHGYFDVDYDIVWGIVQNNMQPLLTSIDSILSRHDK